MTPEEQVKHLYALLEEAYSVINPYLHRTGCLYFGFAGEECTCPWQVWRRLKEKS